MKTQVFLMTLLIFGICNPCLSGGREGVLASDTVLPRIISCNPDGSRDFSTDTQSFPCIADGGTVRFGMPTIGNEETVGDLKGEAVFISEDTVLLTQPNSQRDGIPVDPNRLLMIKGYSDLYYGFLEGAIDERVKDLTDITVISMERGLCNTAETIPNSCDLDLEKKEFDHDIKCYSMNLLGVFNENPAKVELFCDVIIFAGDRLSPNLLLRECGNDEYIVNFGSESDGSKKNLVPFEELGLIRLATRRKIVQ